MARYLLVIAIAINSQFAFAAGPLVVGLDPADGVPFSKIIAPLSTNFSIYDPFTGMSRLLQLFNSKNNAFSASCFTQVTLLGFPLTFCSLHFDPDKTTPETQISSIDRYRFARFYNADEATKIYQGMGSEAYSTKETIQVDGHPIPRLRISCKTQNGHPQVAEFCEIIAIAD